MKWEDHPELTAGTGEEDIRKTGSFVIPLAIVSVLKNWKVKMMVKALFWIKMDTQHGMRASQVSLVTLCILMVTTWDRIEDQLDGKCTMLDTTIIFRKKKVTTIRGPWHNRRQPEKSRIQYSSRRWIG